MDRYYGTRAMLVVWVMGQTRYTTRYPLPPGVNPIAVDKYIISYKKQHCDLRIVEEMCAKRVCVFLNILAVQLHSAFCLLTCTFYSAGPVAE